MSSSEMDQDDQADLCGPSDRLVLVEEEDGLLHFRYKDLEANAVTEDLILFPGDASFVKVRLGVFRSCSKSLTTIRRQPRAG